jgi:flagellar biosynthesis protein FliP
LKQLDKDNEAYLERKEKIMEEKKQQEALKVLAKSKQREAISAKLYKVFLGVLIRAYHANEIQYTFPITFDMLGSDYAWHIFL